MGRTEIQTTHSEEDPLQQNAPVIRVSLAVETKDIVLVVMLLQVNQNCGGLEDGEVVPAVVDDDGDTPVRVQLDEPWLLLNVL